MELAVRVLCVNQVGAFGRFVIAFNLLRADRDRSERDLICFEDFAALQQGHAVSRFQNDNLICLNWGSSRGAIQPQDEDNRELNASVAHIA